MINFLCVLGGLAVGVVLGFAVCAMLVVGKEGE